MRKNAFVFIIFTIILTFNGCATMSKPKEYVEPQRTVSIINAHKDKVWPVLVSEIGLNYPIQIMDKESGLITTQTIIISNCYDSSMGWYVYIPDVWLAVWDGLRMRMNITATEAVTGNETMVKIRIHYEAYERNVTKSWMEVGSNGALEDCILTNIENKLKSRSKNIIKGGSEDESK